MDSSIEISKLENIHGVGYSLRKKKDGEYYLLKGVMKYSTHEIEKEYKQILFKIKNIYGDNIPDRELFNLLKFTYELNQLGFIDIYSFENDDENILFWFAKNNMRTLFKFFPNNYICRLDFNMKQTNSEGKTAEQCFPIKNSNDPMFVNLLD